MEGFGVGGADEEGAWDGAGAVGQYRWWEWEWECEGGDGEEAGRDVSGVAEVVCLCVARVGVRLCLVGSGYCLRYAWDEVVDWKHSGWRHERR